MSDTSPSFRALDIRPVCPEEDEPNESSVPPDREGCDDWFVGLSAAALEESVGPCWDSEVLRYLRPEEIEEIDF